MNAQQLHIIDTALEVLMSGDGREGCRRLKNAIYDCIRCRRHRSRLRGEPYHCEMNEVNIATLSAILMEMGFPLEKT